MLRQKRKKKTLPGAHSMKNKQKKKKQYFEQLCIQNWSMSFQKDLVEEGSKMPLSIRKENPRGWGWSWRYTDAQGPGVILQLKAKVVSTSGIERPRSCSTAFLKRAW